MTQAIAIPVFATTDKPLLTVLEATAQWLSNDGVGHIQSSAVQIIGDGRVGFLQTRITADDGTVSFKISPPQTADDSLLGWGTDEDTKDFRAALSWPAHTLRPINMGDVVSWILSVRNPITPLTTADLKHINLHPRTKGSWQDVVAQVYRANTTNSSAAVSRLDSAAYGLEWAIVTFRASTAVTKAVKAMSAYQVGKLLLEIANAGLTTNATPRWLNEKFA